MLLKSGEDYLETILVLKNEIGNVRSIDIAIKLGFSKPSISRAVSNLKKDGYIEISEKGYIEFTNKGLDAANHIYNRHIVITRFLTEVLKVNEKTADEDACKIEHIISTETFAQIEKFIRNI